MRLDGQGTGYRYGFLIFLFEEIAFSPCKKYHYEPEQENAHQEILQRYAKLSRCDAGGVGEKSTCSNCWARLNLSLLTLYPRNIIVYCR